MLLTSKDCASIYLFDYSKPAIQVISCKVCFNVRNSRQISFICLMSILRVTLRLPTEKCSTTSHYYTLRFECMSMMEVDVTLAERWGLFAVQISYWWYISNFKLLMHLKTMSLKQVLLRADSAFRHSMVNVVACWTSLHRHRRPKN